MFMLLSVYNVVLICVCEVLFMYGYVYKVENTINDKIYIGKKKSSVFLGNRYLGSGKYIKDAVNKYGSDKFRVILLEWCTDKECLNNREIYWISYYRDNGFKLYNVTNGGDGGNTFLYLSTDDRRLRCQNISKNSYFRHCTPQDRYKAWETRRKNGNDIFSEEYRQKLSDSHKGKKRSEESILKGIETKNKHYNGQYKHTEETKRKISKSNKGKTHNLSEQGLNKLIELGKQRCGDKNTFYGKSHTNKTKQIISKSSKSNWRKNKYKWIYNETESRRVPLEDVNKYLSMGYKIGRGKLK